jgi:hypothetical protein
MSRARESTLQKKAQERRRKAELYSDSARGYLRDHNIPAVVNAALEKIILEQPDDPLLMLQHELQSYNAQGVRSSMPGRSPRVPHVEAVAAQDEGDDVVLEVVEESSPPASGATPQDAPLTPASEVEVIQSQSEEVFVADVVDHASGIAPDEPTSSRAISPANTAASEAVLDIEEDDGNSAAA